MDEGFTKIQNWLLAKMYRADDLTFREMRVLLYLVRKLHGFHKDSDKISYGQIAEGTGIAQRHVIDTVKLLEEKKLIRVRRKKNSINIITLKGSDQNSHRGSDQKGRKSSDQNGHPQKKYQKSVLSSTPLGEAALKEKKYKEMMEEIDDTEYE